MTEINILYEYVHGWELMLERRAKEITRSINEKYGTDINFYFIYPYQTREEILTREYDFFISHISKVVDNEPCPTKDAPLSVYRRANDIKKLSPKTITIAESTKFGTITGSEILNWFDDWSKPVLTEDGEPLIRLLIKKGYLTDEEKTQDLLCHYL